MRRLFGAKKDKKNNFIFLEQNFIYFFKKEQLSKAKDSA